MPAETTTLPITETLVAESEAHVAELLKLANETRTPVYPIGGGTSLGLGLPAKSAGIGLQLSSIDKVIDYPARDMTITVGAGVALAKLQQTLARESQRLPIDCPFSSQATLGGLIASNHSGPLRFGYGTMRDHVIGIRAVDGRGEEFAAGGRVVKNVAGYDFCKLLTGSMGTLGVITEVTLKLKPIPMAKAFVACRPTSLVQAEELLARLIDSATTPTVVELLYGLAWSTAFSLGESATGWLVVGFEGTEVEVDWMTKQLGTEWREQGVDSEMIHESEYEVLNQKLIDFPADDQSALVVQLTGVPSGVTRGVETLKLADEKVDIQAHAGNGVVIGKFADYPGSLAPFKAVAAASHGSATVLSNPSGTEMTHHNVWGTADVPFDIMQRVKVAFDPNNILNPGRFVY